MAAISIRLSDNDKSQADNLFKKLGITTNSAINMFIKQCIIMQSLPFIPSLDVPNKKLLKSLEESGVVLKEMKDGKRHGFSDADSLFDSLNR